jgi:hypothetical protein
MAAGTARLRYATRMLLLLLACDFSAATTVKESDTGSVTTEDSDSRPSGDDTDSPPESQPPDPEDVDDDGDGTTENQGDCNDSDPSIHPGVEDQCDEVDEDCDGDVDEDGGIDEFEPNDVNAHDFGSLETDKERTVTAILQNDADVDRYQFTIVDDLLDFFTVTATLSNVPSGANWRFSLVRLRSDANAPLGEVSSETGGPTITLTMSDDILQDEGGDYELVVESLGGADCSRSYLLSVEQ